MKIADLKELLKDSRVIEEINKHLWIESQKAGYSIGIERATDEWLRLYAEGWMRYNNPDAYRRMMKMGEPHPSSGTRNVARTSSRTGASRGKKTIRKAKPRKKNA